jgi:hypothetical protein
MFELFLFVVLVILQGLDIWTTKTILDNGGKELNPVMRFLMEKIGVMKALFLMKIMLVIVVGYGVFTSTLSLILLGLVCILYAIVVASNWKHLPK